MFSEEDCYICYEEIKNKNVLISTVLQFDAKVEERVLTIEVLYHRETASTSNSLELGGLSMTNYDLRCLAIGLQDNLTVKSLNISHNCLTEKGIETVIDCLSKNSSIKELDISHNEISIVSIKIFFCSEAFTNKIRCFRHTF